MSYYLIFIRENKTSSSRLTITSFFCLSMVLYCANDDQVQISDECLLLFSINACNYVVRELRVPDPLFSLLYIRLECTCLSLSIMRSLLFSYQSSNLLLPNHWFLAIKYLVNCYPITTF